MFWKKKKVETYYVAIGVNYNQLNEINGNSIIEDKENLFSQIEKIGNSFTKENIEILSDKVGYDVFNALIWIDTNVYNNPIKNRSYRVCYQFKGFRLGLVPQEFQKPLLDKISQQLFFTRTELETLSAEFGFSVYDRCEWNSVSIVTLTIPNINFEISYYQK